MTPTEFMKITPLETVMFIHAAAWRTEELSRTAMWHAWHTAVLAGANFSKAGVPPLDKLLPSRRRRTRPMTIDEEVAYWDDLADDYAPLDEVPS